MTQAQKPNEFIRGRQRTRGKKAQLILDRDLHLRPGDSFDTIQRNGRVIGVAVYRAGFFKRLWTKVKP